MDSMDSVQFTTRPALLRVISLASSSTRRCFMKPVNDMPCGAASALTGRLPPSSASMMPRRVRSASAEKISSSASSVY